MGKKDDRILNIVKLCIRDKLELIQQVGETAVIRKTALFGAERRGNLQINRTVGDCCAFG